MTNKEYRFAIGQKNGPVSCTWKVWTSRDDVYLVQRNAGGSMKFSFHRSGWCRWAQLHQPKNGGDRVMMDWQRDEVPPAGFSKGAFLMGLAFPTNYLSTSFNEPHTNIEYLEPAESGRALRVEKHLTNESEEHLRKLNEKSMRKIHYHKMLKNGSAVIVTSFKFDCGPIEIQVPREPMRAGQVFGDLIFSEMDHAQTGRPVRILIIPEKERPPTVWELGGHQRTKLIIENS